MDLVLEILDEYALDKLYAHLVPASAFAAFNASHSAAISSNTSFSLPFIHSGPASSAWSNLVSYLPHPPLTEDLLLTPSQASSLPFSSAWPRDYIPRQLLSLSVITLLGIYVLYFVFATMAYYTIFNHEMMKHPRFLKNQVRQEIMCSLRAFPGMIALTLPWFLGEVRGYSKMYDNVDDFGWTYFFASILMYLVFTDYGIYWIHRWEHHPICYKWLHKPHHKWIIPTPFASHAFHPLDGYLQSIPYHLFIFVIPFHRKLYLFLFVVINFWTILIHDSDMITDHPLETIINGPAHHTLHHMFFTVNYGQYFTWADRMGGSYRQPAKELDPMLEVKAAEAKKKQGKDQ
ncbi:hypothetical protein QCA50_005708 [Cerrena zonata]|uniref:Fatty acid hydroxylase domain-containing protein n=1 Tax=Cerrena zonata TaxID=2478898 RepID=A0AAW0GLV0_9APHY